MKIRKRLILSNIAMLVVPLILISLVGGFSRHILGTQTRFAEFRRHSGELVSAQTLAVSTAIAGNPRFLEDSAAIRKLVESLGWDGDVAIYSGGRELWLSPGADSATVRNAIAELSTSGQPSSAVHPRFSQTGWIAVSTAWAFAVPGGGIATLYFLTDYRRQLAGWLLPVGGFFLLLALILVFTNVLLAVLVSRSVLLPLRGLESRAIRIRDGDLSPLPEAGLSVRRGCGTGGGPRCGDEFDSVFRVFDEMRERLKSSLERQESMERNRQELIASISHDLRTPLAAIKGYAEGLSDGVADSPERSGKYIETILGKTALMERLIDDLFLFSRLELADFPYDKRRLDLAAWLRDFTGELAPDFPALKIDVTPTAAVSASAGPCMVLIDPFRMGRVIANIVQNAAAYAGRPDASLAIDISRDGDRAIVRCSDNGPGIAPADRERVFECHYRADASRHREGTGLGLTIARLIVEGHCGTIRAEDATPEEGGGACLVLSLPLERA